MGQCLLQGVHHLHRQDVVPVLRLPVLLRGRGDSRQDCPGPLTAPQLHLLFGKPRLHQGQGLLRDVLVDQQGLQGVAHRGPGALAVVHHFRRHPKVRGSVHVGVAVAHPGLDHRDFSVLLHRADEPRPAPGNEHVQVLGQGHQLPGGLAAGVLHQLHAVPGQAPGLQGVPEHLYHRLVGAEGLFPAPEDHGVAGLQTQGGGVAGHVGTGLVDDADNPQGHGDLLHLQAVGAHLPREDPAHRVRGGGHLSHGLGHGGDPFLRQPQPVQQGGAHPRRLSRGHVLPVGPQNLLPPVPQGGGGQF